jgi:myo-inositol-1(or 4)-monophosphatase
MPILKKLYYAEKGKGAFCNGKRISVSKTNTLKRCLMIFDAKLKKDTDMKVKLLKRLAPITWRTRIYGVAVYHNLLVAEGKSEINIDFDSHPWDHSAALLIVEEAGGKVTGIDGKKWNPYIKNYVSSNGKIHKKLLNVLKN